MNKLQYSSILALTLGLSAVGHAALTSMSEDFESVVLTNITGGSGGVNNFTGHTTALGNVISTLYEGHTQTLDSDPERFIDNVADISNIAFGTQFHQDSEDDLKQVMNLTNTAGYIYYDLGDYAGETSLIFASDFAERNGSGNVTLTVSLFRNNGFSPASGTDVATTGTLLGNLNLTTTTFAPAGTQTYENVSNSIDLTSIAGLNTGDDLFLRISNGSTSVQNVTDNHTITVVPEPSSAALLGLGGLALILRRRK